MRVLLTSPRAPVTLDLARRFVARGDEVFLCDRLRFGCGSLSRHPCRKFRVPGPRQSPTAYVDALDNIVNREKIDLLVPTCEEIFYISACRDRIGCDVFTDSFDKLRSIHNKWVFAQIASNAWAKVPETHEVVSRDEIRPFLDRSTEWVFKPTYSRFAAETLIAPTPDQLLNLAVSPGKRWVAQRLVRGTEYSTYSVAIKGKLVAHTCYVSLYRAGRGSGIYFKCESHRRIAQFVQTFVAQVEYTGQIGFDCIVDEDGILWIIEGNPRATSGLHLFGDNEPLIDAILGNRHGLLETASHKPRMIAAAMPVWGLAQAFRQRSVVRYTHDLWRGRDVLFQWNDPMPALGLPITMAELMLVSLREGKTLQQATTHDIEWNGEDL